MENLGVGLFASNSTIIPGGIAISTIVNAGGSENIFSAGVASGTTIFAGGSQMVRSGGIASGTILSGGTEFVSSGGTTSGTFLSSGATEIISSGGSASGTTIFGGGSETVSFGGVDSGAVLSGGEQDVFGAASGALLDANAVQFVESGGVASGTTVDATDAQIVLFSGTASDTTVNSGGTVELESGATLYSLTVNSGGTVSHVDGSAVISGGNVVNSGTIDAEAPGGSLFIDPADAPATFTNAGTIMVRNGDDVLIQPGIFTNFEGGALIGGTYDIGAGSIIELGFNQFVTELDSATLILGGSGATLEASNGAFEVPVDQSLTTIGPGGTLIVSGDASPFFANTLTDVGTLQLGGVETQTSGITIVGTRSVTLDGVDESINGTISDDVANSVGPGVGTVVVNGGGIVLLAGNNSYTGGTFVSDSGTVLQILDDSNLGGNGTVALGPGTTLELTNLEAGAYPIAHTITVTGDPIFQVDDGVTVTDFGLITNGSGPGTVELAGDVLGAGTLVLDNAGNSYTGGTIIDSGTLEIAVSGAAGAGGITFAPQIDPTLRIDAAALPADTTFENVVSGFTSADTFDLLGVSFDGSGHADLNPSNLLVVTDGGNFYDIQLAAGDDFTGDFFHLSPNGSGGTLVTEDTTPCYCGGTLILTPEGEVPVEALRTGDLVVSLSGDTRPIDWIGRRSYSGLFVIGRADVLPVCATAGALADNVPRRDLWLSPNHALYLEGVLIEAKDLVNGVSVYQPSEIETVEYFHLELASHDVILAEGAAAETYIDDDNRGLFHNAAEYWAAYPDEVRKPAQYCAPRQEEGFAVERARRLLAERAGIAMPVETAPATLLRGHVDAIGRRQIVGWAWDEAMPDAPVCLDVYVGDVVIGQVVANRYRADLETAGIGTGRHGFVFTPPKGLAFAPGAVTVCRAHDGAALMPSQALERQAARHLRRKGRKAS